MEVIVSLRSDRSGKLADSGKAICDPDAGPQGQVIFRWRRLCEVQCGKKINAGGLIENGERSLRVAVTHIQNRILAEDMGKPGSKRPRVVGLTSHIAREPLRCGHVIV